MNTSMSSTQALELDVIPLGQLPQIIVELSVFVRTVVDDHTLTHLGRSGLILTHLLHGVMADINVNGDVRLYFEHSGSDTPGTSLL